MKLKKRGSYDINQLKLQRLRTKRRCRSAKSIVLLLANHIKNLQRDIKKPIK